MAFIKETATLIRKEFLMEWRSKYALNGILIYVFATVFICYLSFKKIDPITWNALFWIILLFTSINAIAKSFMQENRSRYLYYYTIVNPAALILSKIIYNLILMSIIAFVCLVFYTIVFNNPIQDLTYYLLAVAMGGLSFASMFTMVSAIASKANNNSTLMAILSFPVIVPLLMLLIKFSKNAMDGIDRASSNNEIGVLLLINIIVFAVSLLLFPYIWRD
jgi:heme exporter protein B